MIRIFITTLIYLIGLLTQAQEGSEIQGFKSDSGYAVNVELKNISESKGTVFFALYVSQNDFDNRKSLITKKKKADENGVNIVFENVPNGIYAITCYHDKNDNGKLDFTVNGMPLEQYGSTNNIKNFGPPRFDDGKFELRDKDLTFEIRL